MAAVLTLMASPSPSRPSQTQSGTAVPSTDESATPDAPTGSASACTDRAGFVSDVTVRDGSEVAPGAPFVKIWRLENTGTCVWSTAYSLVFFGGERMGASSSVPLSGAVEPGTRVDLPVDMIAPARAGTFQGFWRLRNSDGALFGIGPAGDQSFWVKIVVLAATPPVGTSPAPPTPTPTPLVVAAGGLNLNADDSADLDGGSLNPPTGADLAYRQVSPTEAALEPQNGAQLALLAPSGTPPAPADCLASPLSPSPLAASEWSSGAWICYRTDQGRTGYLAVSTANGGILATYLTWGP